MYYNKTKNTRIPLIKNYRQDWTVLTENGFGERAMG